MHVAWTTVGSAADAEMLASGIVAAGLAACAQVDGPVTSHYRWEGRQERSTEWRITLKIPAPHLAAAEAWVAARHPYSTPQWIAVAADRVAENYLQWAAGNT